jgi:hypothetical protein
MLSSVIAEDAYFGKLLEPPNELPISVEQLRDFLSERKMKLPLLDVRTYSLVSAPGLVKVYDSDSEKRMAGVVNNYFFGKNFGENEATSSSYLFELTARFLSFLNKNAPPENTLPNFRLVLDSVEVVSESALSAVEALKRPDC